MKSELEIQSQLQKPGAGIPFYARLINQFILKPFIVRRLSWEDVQGQFDHSFQKIKNEIADFPEEFLLQRVLVPPQVGLEDSSRYWSAAMAVRHLTIVGKSVEPLIVMLSQGQTVPIKVDIAKVKPELEKNSVDAIPEYIKFAESLNERLQRHVKNKDSKTTHKHPWFGEMTAKDWYWLQGVHIQIHHRQIKNIKKIILSGK